MNLKIEVPGKVFILGEYAVLADSPAIVAAVPPRFQLVEESASLPLLETPLDFHPESPAGRLLARDPELSKSLSALRFEDPHGGAGGFGASTAQFAALKFYSNLARPIDWKTAWMEYQEFQNPASRGSGADLVAQLLGGVCIFDPKGPTVTNLTSFWDWSALMVFSATRNQAPRKTTTHTHLDEFTRKGGLSKASTQELKAIVTTALDAIDVDPKAENPETFGRCLDAYADALQRLDLEDPLMTTDRQALRALPGVMGAKGCGAKQSDALIVLMDRRNPDLSLRQDVIEAAQARGLSLITASLVPERGITWSA